MGKEAQGRYPSLFEYGGWRAEMEGTHLAAVLGLGVCKNPFPRVFQLGID